MSKKQTRSNTKKKTFFCWSKAERKDKHVKKNLQICENVQQKGKKYLKHAEVSGRVFEMKNKKRRQDSLKIKKNHIRGRSFQEENYSFF